MAAMPSPLDPLLTVDKFQVPYGLWQPYICFYEISDDQKKFTMK